MCSNPYYLSSWLNLKYGENIAHVEWLMVSQFFKKIMEDDIFRKNIQNNFEKNTKYIKNSFFMDVDNFKYDI